MFVSFYNNFVLIIHHNKINNYIIKSKSSIFIVIIFTRIRYTKQHVEWMFRERRRRQYKLRFGSRARLWRRRRRDGSGTKIKQNPREYFLYFRDKSCKHADLHYIHIYVTHLHDLLEEYNDI